MEKLTYNLIKSGWLKTGIIIEAFKKIKREDFLPDELKRFKDLDEALPIGFGQTISQPSVVAFMLELLQPGIGDKILDIGSGSGWTAALLSSITDVKGSVISIEILPEVLELGKRNVKKYNFVEKGIVQFVCMDGSRGFEKEAPYDKILVSASADSRESIEELRSQLKIMGRLVVPIKGSIWLFIKESEKNFYEKEYPGFLFVPLV